MIWFATASLYSFWEAILWRDSARKRAAVEASSCSPSCSKLALVQMLTLGIWCWNWFVAACTNVGFQVWQFNKELRSLRRIITKSKVIHLDLTVFLPLRKGRSSAGFWDQATLHALDNCHHLAHLWSSLSIVLQSLFHIQQPLYPYHCNQSLNTDSF